jgi:hypothetical protein
MSLSLRQTAAIVLALGIAMIAIAVWLERRRRHQLMPSLIPPTALLLLGGMLAVFALAIILLPDQGVVAGLPKRPR